VSRLKRRLILIFAAVTIVPLCATLYLARILLDRTFHYAAGDLDRVSLSLESAARQLYLREREELRRDAAAGRTPPEKFPVIESALWPADVVEFWNGGQPERFGLAGDGGSTITLLVRRENEVLRFARPAPGGVRLGDIQKQHAEARRIVEQGRARDVPRAVFLSFMILTAVPWMVAFAILAASVHRISNAAMRAYDRMAGELQQSRERLLFLTRLESWQALARKTAHEVKNSLTPIRLTMEELADRHPDPESFEHQAAGIIADEVTGLERRVRAFSEFAAEPPVRLRTLDAAELLRERVAFLRAAHPDVEYDIRQDSAARVVADEDLLRAVLTNLLENAAEAAGPKGRVLARAGGAGRHVVIDVHDSGPGLSPQAAETLFEPAISFKKGGMGLGLSIARKSAVLCGGDIVTVHGELGGAGFRVLLPAG